jgi:hypothetical protein
MFAIDEHKTEFLRKKIRQMKEEEQEDVAPKTKVFDTIHTIIVVLLRVFAFFGTQYYILERTAIEPFTVWQSVVIYMGISAFISLFKKSS